jgi:hypothetical protein
MPLLSLADLYRMTGDHVREQEGVSMHTNFSQMLLKEHLNASQLPGESGDLRPVFYGG